MRKSLLVLGIVLGAGCVDFEADRQLCRSQGRCADGGSGSGGAGGGINGVGGGGGGTGGTGGTGGGVAGGAGGGEYKIRLLLVLR